MAAFWRTVRRGRLPGESELFDAVVCASQEMRSLLDAFTRAGPDASVWHGVADELSRLTATLREHPVPEAERVVGRLVGVPGRGQALVPPILVDALGEGSLAARVTFGAHYVGWGGVHGGALSLVFDELMGVLAHADRSARSRTAYLKVDYQSVVPEDVELQVSLQVSRQEGRKRWLTGTLRDGTRLCAQAEALFVSLTGTQA